jgi:hypothetical protein
MDNSMGGGIWDDREVPIYDDKWVRDLDIADYRARNEIFWSLISLLRVSNSITKYNYACTNPACGKVHHYEEMVSLISYNSYGAEVERKVCYVCGANVVWIGMIGGMEIKSVDDLPVALWGDNYFSWPNKVVRQDSDDYYNYPQRAYGYRYSSDIVEPYRGGGDSYWEPYMTDSE